MQLAPPTNQADFVRSRRNAEKTASDPLDHEEGRAVPSIPFSGLGGAKGHDKIKEMTEP